MEFTLTNKSELYRGCFESFPKASNSCRISVNGCSCSLKNTRLEIVISEKIFRKNDKNLFLLFFKHWAKKAKYEIC